MSDAALCSFDASAASALLVGERAGAEEVRELDGEVEEDASDVDCDSEPEDSCSWKAEPPVPRGTDLSRSYARSAMPYTGAVMWAELFESAELCLYANSF